MPLNRIAAARPFTGHSLAVLSAPQGTTEGSAAAAATKAIRSTKSHEPTRNNFVLIAFRVGSCDLVDHQALKTLLIKSQDEG
jgi:hypothetical protein